MPVQLFLSDPEPLFFSPNLVWDKGVKNVKGEVGLKRSS